MLQGTVESISKSSVVVSVGGKAETLTGAAVTKIAPTLKLGDVVDFDNAENTTQITKASGKTGQNAAPRSSGSPAAKVPSTKNDAY